MGKRFLRKKSGQFNGSLAAPAPVPTVAPPGVLLAPDVPTGPAPRLLPSDTYGLRADDDIEAAFVRAGVVNAAGAATEVRLLLNEDGDFVVEAPVYDAPPDPFTIQAALAGHVELYLTHREVVAGWQSNQEIADHAVDIDSRYPGAYTVVADLLDDRSMLDVGSLDLTPAALDGALSAPPHPWTQRLNPDTLTYEDAPPINMGEIVALHERGDHTLRNVRELAAATYMKGRWNLRSGNWKMDHDTLADSILDADLDDDASYEALALVYSGGKSSNTGFDAVWEPDPNAPAPSARVRSFLAAAGRDGEWFSFGQWATANT